MNKIKQMILKWLGVTQLQLIELQNNNIYFDDRIREIKKDIYLIGENLSLFNQNHCKINIDLITRIRDIEKEYIDVDTFNTLCNDVKRLEDK